jgi:hypothetical protein
MKKLTTIWSFDYLKPGDLICCVNNKIFGGNDRLLQASRPQMSHYLIDSVSMYLSHKTPSLQTTRLFEVKILHNGKIVNCRFQYNDYKIVFKKYEY